MARRRGIKIAKGVRLNFNKTGTSVTFTNKGILGGTHSNTVRLTGGKGKSATNKSTTNHSSTLQGRYDFTLNDDGTVIFYDSSGNRVYDESLIRKMKSTDAFRHQKSQILERRKAEKQAQFLEEQNEKFNDIQDETDSIIAINKHCAKVISEKDCINMLERIAPREYKKESYSEPVPMRDHVIALLNDEAAKNVKAPFWKKKKAISEYVDQHIEDEYNKIVATYNERKEKFEKDEDEKAHKMNSQYIMEAENKKREICKIMENNPEYIEKKTEEWLRSIMLPVDFEVDFEYNSNTGSMFVDLTLPKLEEIPKEKAVRLANGTVKAKAKTQKEIKQEYIICVFGLALFVSSHLFNINTSINTIVVSGYVSQRDDRTGNIRNDCIYSLKIPRNELECSDLTQRDPQQFCLSLENHCNITASLILKPVEPFDNM